MQLRGLARAGCGIASGLERRITVPLLCPDRFPDWLVVGFQKCGTTWLHANMTCHEDLFLPESKEVHYFNSKFHLPLLSYLAKFKRARTNQRVGEITPRYASLSERKIRFIRKCNPDLKVVFVLRNPLERIWSLAMMSLGLKKGRSPEDIPQHELNEVLDKFPFSTYVPEIDLWSQIFGRQNILVIFNDHIAATPERVLRDVFQHLGVSPDVSFETFPVRERIFPGNKSRRPPEWDEKIRSRFRSPMLRLAERYPDPASDWLT